MRTVFFDSLICDVLFIFSFASCFDHYYVRAYVCQGICLAIATVSYIVRRVHIIVHSHYFTFVSFLFALSHSLSLFSVISMDVKVSVAENNEWRFSFFLLTPVHLLKIQKHIMNTKNNKFLTIYAFFAFAWLLWKKQLYLFTFTHNTCCLCFVSAEKYTHWYK